MENNEIMKRLMQDSKQNKSSEKESESTTKTNNDTAVSKIRIVTAKYKVYIVLILIFICFMCFDFIPDAQDAYEASQNSLEQVNNEFARVNRDLDDAKKDVKYLRNIVENEGNLKDHLDEEYQLMIKKNNGDYPEEDEEVDCSRLPEDWITWTWKNKSCGYKIPLSYLQLHSLYNEKMPVDEKRVIKNLNEYLIKQDIWEEKTRVWDILKIEIWDPENVNKWDEHFVSVPVDVKIEFVSIENLIDFLYNVEKRLINEWEDRILYKIQAVSYDVVTKDEPQITDISMLAYYYHDEKFDGINEYEAILWTGNKQDLSEDSRTDDNKNNSWESLIDEIFDTL